jgi:hypothetical protein
MKAGAPTIGNKTPSGKFQGSFDLTNKYTVPADHRGPLELTANVRLEFGYDHRGTLEIKLYFQEEF